MKTIIVLLCSGFVALTALGQPAAPRAVPVAVGIQAVGEEQPLPKFDLNFGGGTPRDLVGAIEKASGKPLNAIVPDEFAALLLPALKMKAVTVPQLFAALEAASRKAIPYSYSQGGMGVPVNYQQMVTSYGFRTQGPIKEDSVWYFYQEKPNPPPQPQPKVCRFWQLGPYLGVYTIDDITTAIKTGWDMLGEAVPAMNFHKDTKLLIAVGEPEKLALIDSVLRELPKAEKSAPTKPAEPAKQ